MDANPPSAIIGVTKTCRTFVDGSLVIQLEIEPRHAQAAFALFGAPGTPVAVARIIPEVAQSQARQEVTAGQMKGGTLSKLAGMFCGDLQFQAWMTIKYKNTHIVEDETDAALIMRAECGIQSRADLDHNEAAADLFHTEFRLPYNAWLQGRG